MAGSQKHHSVAMAPNDCEMMPADNDGRQPEGSTHGLVKSQCSKFAEALQDRPSHPLSCPCSQAAQMTAQHFDHGVQPDVKSLSASN